jgi:hypothetical protein
VDITVLGSGLFAFVTGWGKWSWLEKFAVSIYFLENGSYNHVVAVLFVYTSCRQDN